MPYSGPKWDLGQQGEEVIRRWLQGYLGFFVVPITKISTGHAPMLEGLRFRAVLPDFMASIRGASRWVEVKTKSTAPFYAKAQRHQHGFKEANWLDYIACEEQTGIPGYICVLQLDTNEVLLQSIQRLATDIQRGTMVENGERVPHVFFPRDGFDRYEGPDDSPAPVTPTAPRFSFQKPPPSDRQLPFDFTGAA